MMLLALLKDLLFPPKCVLCGRLLEKEETDLCNTCRVDGPVYPRPGTKKDSIDRWTAVWYYDNTVRRSLLRFKFRGARSYAGAYGRQLAMKLDREALTDFQILTWVPVSGRRLRKRGYDQARLIAEATARELGTQAQRTLEKARDNPPQSGIRGQAHRRANVLGVFRVTDPALVRGKKVLLLDDILTTGATACECARVLLTAGAEEVLFAAVAAAGPNKENR